MLWRRGRPYAQDLCERVFAAADAGLPVGRIAEALFVSISYVSKVLSRRRNTGETTARPQHCHVPRKLRNYFTAIREQVAARPDATLDEPRQWLRETHEVSVSLTLLLGNPGSSRVDAKKRPCTPRSRTVPTLPRPAPNGVRTSPV